MFSVVQLREPHKALCDNVLLSPLSPISFPGRRRYSLLHAGLSEVLTEKNIHLIKCNSADTCVINVISIAPLRKQAESRDCLVEVYMPRRYQCWRPAAPGPSLLTLHTPGLFMDPRLQGWWTFPRCLCVSLVQGE